MTVRTWGRALALAGAAALLAAAWVPAAAQSWRTVTAARERGDADSLRVQVALGAGTVRLAAAAQPVLYDVNLRFDAAHVRPRQHYDAATHTLIVRSDSVRADPLSFSLRNHSVWHADAGDDRGGTTLGLGLAPGVPLDLDLSLGACETTLDLSHLSVQRLQLRTGASESTITFGTPNPIAMSSLDIVIGAADLTVHSLGNAHAAAVSVKTGVGGADLDLGGQWTGTMQLAVRAAVGGVTVRVPGDVGIQAHADTKLANLDAAGLTLRDGAYYSANWAAAARRVTLDIHAVLANVTITHQ